MPKGKLNKKYTGEFKQTVLGEQLEEITNGYIKKNAIRIACDRHRLCFSACYDKKVDRD